jgi:hypothetical protein
MPSCVGLPQTEEAESAASPRRPRTTEQWGSSTLPRAAGQPRRCRCFKRRSPSLRRRCFERLSPSLRRRTSPVPRRSPRAALKSGSDHRADDGQTGKTVL